MELLGAGDVVRILPQLRADDVVGGSFCATDGFVDPYSVMNGFAARAMERGARIEKGVEVTAILQDERVWRASRPAAGPSRRERW